MEYVIYSIIGVASGILGGMGMGGGTLLIPLLNILTGVDQLTAQTINLISFIPMSVVALVIHCKKKLVEKRGVLYIIIPAVISGALSSYLAKLIGSTLLKKGFGMFLIIFAFIQLNLGEIAVIKEYENNVIYNLHKSIKNKRKLNKKAKN